MMFFFISENEIYLASLPKKVGQTLGAKPTDSGLVFLCKWNGLGKGMIFADATFSHAFPGELHVNPIQLQTVSELFK